MKNQRGLKAVLLISGVILIGIGIAILFAPRAMFFSYGVDLGGNTSLINEIRAPGGALLVGGMLILSGAFVAGMTFTSAVIAAFLYLSYGTSRVLSIIIDGVPAQEIVVATAVELAIGLIVVAALLAYRRAKRGQVTG